LTVGIEVYSDAVRLANAAAEHVIALAGEAIAARGRFSLALSGGSTPRALYALLATDKFARRVDWSRVHFFWGDERYVPPNHPDSNYRMTRETLLNKVPTPAPNVHPIPTDMGPAAAAAEYERILGEFFACPHQAEGAGPQFDLVLLGMGEDGHTASLFPGTAVLHEKKRWVVAHYVQKLDAWRITLSPVAINAAAHVTFVVSGEGKARRLQQVIEGPFQPQALPAQLVSPTHGHLLWLVDAAAASHLRR
jgi:6-phosphogluconolactonase